MFTTTIQRQLDHGSPALNKDTLIESLQKYNLLVPPTQEISIKDFYMCMDYEQFLLTVLPDLYVGIDAKLIAKIMMDIIPRVLIVEDDEWIQNYFIRVHNALKYFCVNKLDFSRFAKEFTQWAEVSIDWWGAEKNVRNHDKIYTLGMFHNATMNMLYGPEHYSSSCSLFCLYKYVELYNLELVFKGLVSGNIFLAEFRERSDVKIIFDDPLFKAYEDEGEKFSKRLGKRFSVFRRKKRSKRWSK